jgi:hypothetical protein
MPFTKFSNLDFDQIKESIKDYIRANSNFTGFDFEGSNMSILIDTLAYNTYINSFNANMIVNESFLDSATLRENVVSLARNIGYVPRSRTAANTSVTFTIELGNSDDIIMPPTATLERGLAFVANQSNTSYIFSTLNDHTAPVVIGSDNIGRSTFENIKIYQGTPLVKKFQVDTSLNQRFILDNANIDTSTIKVYVSEQEGILGDEFYLIDDIVRTDENSSIYLIQEIQDERYELFFGDGLIGRKLENGSYITVRYIATDGSSGNSIEDFSFAGQLISPITNQSLAISGFLLGTKFDSNNNEVSVPIQKTSGGGEIESLESIKTFAPKIYSTQNRAVTSNDYESLIKKIYPPTESVSVVGGEELDPPQYGNVQISIKPRNGFFVSDFDKTRILSELKKYSISGINQKIIDLKILYVEIDSSIYYDETKVSTENTLKTQIVSSLNNYANSLDLNKFGGRFKYSKVLGIIDSTNKAVTSNITKVKIRRNLNAFINQLAQYEICFGNQFHVKSEGYNIKSTGFTISGETSTVYLTDIPNADKKTGILSIVKIISNDEIRVVSKSAGTIDYVKGEINLTTINITSTIKPNNVIEIEAIPESNDVVGLKDLYINFDVSRSKINMVKDVISSGEEISGAVFVRNSYTSSYSNGTLIRE